MALVGPVLYTVAPNPAARAVLVTAKAIDLRLQIKEMDYGAGEHLKPEFIKINPQHTLPTLVDADGFVVWDSHAIITYLVSKYAKNDALYPNDIKRRATIDQRLYFDVEVVFARLRKTVDPIGEGVKKALTREDVNSSNEIYGFLEVFLEGRRWIADDCVTVADYSLACSVSSHNVLVPIDKSAYPKTADWFQRCEELPEYEAGKDGLEVFAKICKDKMDQVCVKK